MNNIDPRILEFAKKEFGDECVLERVSEWSYTFKFGSKSSGIISRFIAEKEFQVKSSEIRRRWPSMNQIERMDFASNFHVKEAWSKNDDEIMDLILDDGDDTIWSSCALAMLRHSNRNHIVEFLIERVLQSKSKKNPPLNYIQALGIARDHRAVTAIRPYYDKYLQAMEAEATVGIPSNVTFGPIPYHAFLSIAGSLYEIEGSQEYEQAIRKYLDHPSEQVRWWAEHALGIDGPTTIARNAEYALKRSQRR